MTLLNFAYKAALDSKNAPADSDMKQFAFEPSNYPLIKNYGNPIFASDGTVIYTSSGKITIQFAGLLFNRSPLGDKTSIVGTTQEFMREWRTAQDSAKQMMWLNMWDNLSGQFVKRLAVVSRPVFDVSGIYVRNFELVLLALDLDTRLYQGGAVSVPNQSSLQNTGAQGQPGSSGTVSPADPTATSTTGDPFEGTYGYGFYGYGYYGHGSYYLSGRLNKFARANGFATVTGVLSSNAVDLQTSTLFRAASYVNAALSVTRALVATSAASSTVTGVVTVS